VEPHLAWSVGALRRAPLAATGDSLTGRVPGIRPPRFAASRHRRVTADVLAGLGDGPKAPAM